MANVENVHVGVCTVTLNGVDLGHTAGGVEVSYEPVYHDVAVDQYGESVVEKYLLGEKWTAKVPLAEYTIANMKKAIPTGTFAGAADARLTIGSNVGKKAKALSYQLVLHPIEEGTRRFDVVFHKAYVGSQVVSAYVNDGERITEVTFEALVDETKSAGNYMGMIGDSTA